MPSKWRQEAEPVIAAVTIFFPFLFSSCLFFSWKRGGGSLFCVKAHCPVVKGAAKENTRKVFVFFFSFCLSELPVFVWTNRPDMTL